MKKAFNYFSALLQRHWVSFLFASIVPAIVGLIAVAATTVIIDSHYGDFVYDSYYNDVICVYSEDIDDIVNSEGFVSNGAYYYTYHKNTETERLLDDYQTIGHVGSIIFDSLPKGLRVIDHEYWKNFPAKIYKGNGFTGTQNEILLDVSNIHNYKIGEEYEFVSTKNDCVVNAVVVGFTRATDYLDFSAFSGILCMPYEDAIKIGAYDGYHGDKRYMKLPSQVLKKLYYKWVSDDIPLQDRHEKFAEDLRSGNFYVPEDHIKARDPQGNHCQTMGSAKRASVMTEEDINKFTMALYLAISLSLLAIVSDLCLNGSMLKRTERVAIRSGLRYKDVSIGYAIKAMLQLLFGTAIMLCVILYYNHKTGALLIMENIWAGVIALFVLGLISWGLDSVRLYLSQRRKRKN